MPEEHQLSAAEVAKKVAAIRQAANQPHRELTEYERGQLNGANNLAEFVLRELARIPGVPDYATPEAANPDDSPASVHLLHPPHAQPPTGEGDA